MSSSAYKYLVTSVPRQGVLLIKLNRPRALNALNGPLIAELLEAVREADSNSEKYGAVVITGDQRAFAAGADIREMQPLTSAENLKRNLLGNWTEFSKFQIPLIAAVEGFALGGGLELAMTCDIIYASKTSIFGQPEIKLGVIPGGGGTQRLIRAIGKSRALEIILTGENFSAVDGEKWGLVSKTFDAGDVLENALDLAESLAEGPRTATRAAKRAVNAANETTLQSGLEYERSIFHSLFGGHEQREGMSAFLEKRKADWDSKL